SPLLSGFERIGRSHFLANCSDGRLSLRESSLDNSFRAAKVQVTFAERKATFSGRELFDHGRCIRHIRIARTSLEGPVMSEFRTGSDHGDERGHCKACRWWQAEHDGPESEDAAIGLCMQPELTHFSLQVTGVSGCNRFEHAKIEELAAAR